jgi:hypothetical protein
MQMVKRLAFLILIATVLTGCFGLFDGGGDHIAESYSTGWIDVHSSRCIEKQDKDGSSIEVVPAYIYAVGHNERFIVAKQHPLPGEFPKERINVTQTNYFLIDLKLQPGQGEKGVYGPMDASQFETLSRKLEVGKIVFDLTYPETP